MLIGHALRVIGALGLAIGLWLSLSSLPGLREPSRAEQTQLLIDRADALLERRPPPPDRIAIARAAAETRLLTGLSCALSGLVLLGLGQITLAATVLARRAVAEADRAERGHD